MASPAVPHTITDVRQGEPCGLVSRFRTEAEPAVNHYSVPHLSVVPLRLEPISSRAMTYDAEDGGAITAQHDNSLHRDRSLNVN